MPVEEDRKDKITARSGEEIGSLRGCLVEGDVEQLARANRVRHRALAVSLLLQAAALAALILVPLIWATDRIALASSPPLPVYLQGGGRQPTPSEPRQQTNHDVHRPCFICDANTISPRLPAGKNDFTGSNRVESTFIGDSTGPGVPAGLSEGFPFTGADSHRPQPPSAPAQKTRRIQVTTIEPAMLIYRVEPVYPAVWRQIRRSGRVELRAIIATDGTMQLLQAVSGDPLFLQSAIDAVRQWRYRPTILNGQAVEVETLITVIYQMQ
jgi:protein TonB